jgi:PKD repeat protein
MKLFLFRLSAILFFFLSSPSFAQDWVKMMQDPNVNFYQLQEEFNKYWDGREIERGKGWKQFRRYEEFAEPRVFPSGDRSLASRAKAYEEFQKYVKDNPISYSRSTAQWQPLGPTGAPSGGGAGRVNCVRFHPNNSNIMYAGTPAGGLWKTTNGGTDWECLTDYLPVIGTTDVAIDHVNPDVIYIATGDGDAGDTHSIGVLKSTDGGKTWNTTGLTWLVNQQRRINRLLIHPTNNQILLAGTSSGIFRTTDAGITWTSVSSSSGIKDMEFNPGNPNIVYAGSTRFLRSTDNGVTWTAVTSGLPSTSFLSRIAIAVTENDDSYVYIVAGGSDNGFYGLYRSTDNGLTFTERSTSPNILGWNANGGDSGGQAWYDLAIAASPLNKNEIYVGGVNIWRSSNGGSSWNIVAHWTGWGAPYVHADHHDLVFIPGTNTLLNGNDGGVNRTTSGGSSWTDLSANMAIAQIYRLGLSASNESLLLTGHQDNGSNRMNGTSWVEVNGGDGMECFVDRTNNNIMFTSIYYGSFYRSTNGGNSFSGITSGLPGNGAWVTPWLQDPVNANTLYAGFNQIFKTTNQGTSWSQIGTISGSGTFRSLAVAPSNNQVIYAARTNTIFKTIDGGSTWTNITQGLPASSNMITYIAIDPDDENNIWVTFSGYSANNKVFNSSNGGANWTNISAGLPNLPVNCVVSQKGTNNAIYIGTDVGVYYKEGSEEWVPYFAGMPNVIVRELEIFYPSSKIRAATYGRGVWECDLFDSQTPAANFTVDRKEVCLGTSVQFTDLSVGTPSGWSWSFPGGTPSSSTEQNPVVTYDLAGKYDVTLIITNNVGDQTVEKKNYITVLPGKNLPITEDFEAVNFPPSEWTILEDGDDDITWQKSDVGGFGNSSSSMMFENYEEDLSGTADEFVSPLFDILDFSAAELNFDVAYARYNGANYDGLAVYISTDCGDTWVSIYEKTGSTLATAPDNASPFVPSASQWRKETIDLTSYIGNTAKIKFQNIAGWGNNLFIDNINITGTGGSGLIAKILSTPSNICNGDFIQFSDDSEGEPTSWEWTFSGGNPETSTEKNPLINYELPGTYSVMLKVSNNLGLKSTFSQITVLSSSENAMVVRECTDSYTLNGETYTADGIYTQSFVNAVGCDSTVTLDLKFVVPTESTLDITRCSSYTLNGQNYTTSGTYTQVVENAAGCDSTITLNLTINQPSTNSIVESSCNNFTLNGITYAATGTFTQLLTNAVGCDSILTINLTITRIDTVVNQAAGVLQARMNGATYQWIDCDNANSDIAGATNQSFTPTNNGRYAVKISSGVCSSVSSCHNIMSVGIGESSFAKNISIFPNPNKGNFTIKFSQVEEAYMIEITDITGKMVYSKLNSASEQIEVELKNESPGMYFVKILSGDNKAIFKVIKE